MMQKLPLSYNQHSSRQLLEVSKFVASSFKKDCFHSTCMYSKDVCSESISILVSVSLLGTNDNIMLPIGATVCVELKKFEEAITWCDKGLAVSFEKSSVLIS